MSSLVKTLIDGQVQILTTFQTHDAQVPAQVFDAWEVLHGAFKVDLTANCRLQIISYLTDSVTKGYVRVYDITSGSIINRVINTTIIQDKLTPSVTYSGIFQLIGGHIYEIQVRAAGNDQTQSFNVLNITPEEV